MAIIAKQIIKERGLKVGDVANELGITHIGLNYNLRGNLTIKTLQAIADAIAKLSNEPCEIKDLFSYDIEREDEGNIARCPHCGKPITLGKGV